MRSHLPLSFLALVAAGAAGTWLYLGAGSQPQPEPAPVSNVEQPAAVPAVLPPLLQAPAPVRKPQRLDGMMQYPDGTFMPTLNNVKVAVRVPWPAEVPFSPIVGRRFSAGTEWYVHADGTQTTTEMSWRSDLNREDAVCHVARPQTALPEEAPEPEAAKK